VYIYIYITHVHAHVYLFSEGENGTHIIYALAVEGHANPEGAQAVVIGRRPVAFTEVDAVASEWSLLRFARQFDQLEEDAAYKVSLLLLVFVLCVCVCLFCVCVCCVCL
jgi:hypothetical protein